MPNQMPGTAQYVRLNMAVPTALIGQTPTWKGQSMTQHTVTPLIPGVCFEARGKGSFLLGRAGAFLRGSRISGHRGTLDMWVTMGATGSARTIAYLTDDLVNPYNYVAIKVDTSNRPLLAIQQIVTPLSAATGILTATGAITNTETVTIDGKVYTVLDTLVDADGNVLKGATVGATLNNLAAAIDLGIGKGTLYADSMTLHSTVSAARGAGDTLVATAKVLGTSGNALTTTKTTANASWGGGTLAGGAGSTTTIANVTPSYTAISASQPVHIRMTWDSENPVSGTRHASLSINEEAIPLIDWATDPVANWAAFQPQYLVLASPLLDAEFNGVIKSVQLSEVVTP